MAYIPSPAVGRSISAFPNKVKPKHHIAEVNATEALLHTSIDDWNKKYFSKRIEYIKSLCGKDILPNYSKEEIAGVLEK